MHELKNKVARLSPEEKYIIDSTGQRIEFDDPRVVHVWIVDFSPYGKRMVERVYEKYGRSVRVAERTNAELLQLARQLCSGRECLLMTYGAGAALKDIQHFRKKDEITLYVTFDSPGNCQFAAWPVIWGTFAERLNLTNALFCVWLKPCNDFLGLGKDCGMDIAKGFILGDLFSEAENTLQCLARDKGAAMEIFEAEFERFNESMKKGERAQKRALAEWAERMAEIPLTAPVAHTPKVFIVGGLNIQYIHYPVTEYLLSQGILPKVADYLDCILWLESHKLMWHGFKKGNLQPEKQYSVPRIISSWLFSSGADRKKAAAALMSRLSVFIFEKLLKGYRKIMERSGLLFDVHVPFSKIAEMGHRHTTYNGFTETPATIGRYLATVETGAYDGFVNLGCFNCPPAMNTQAIIRPLANADDTPYAAIDCEGPSLSVNQKRLLETVAVQAKRMRQKKVEDAL